MNGCAVKCKILPCLYLKNLKRQKWSIRQFKNKIHKGDKVYIWRSGQNAGVVALATILTEPALLEEDKESFRYILSKDHFGKTETRVRPCCLNGPQKRDAFSL